jgi:hypothetical protein
MADRRREFTLEIFDSFEAADEANRQKMRAMTGNERIALLFEMVGRSTATRMQQFSRTYEIVDVPLPRKID